MAKHRTEIKTKANKSAKMTHNTPVVFIVNDNSRAIIQECLEGFGRSKHGLDIMPTNIFTKFDKDRMKTLT